MAAQSPTSAPGADGRIPYLDGVRGVAILCVFLAHLAGGVYPHDVPLLPGLPLPSLGGFIGVQLFFVLSGYLITSILLREAAAHGRIRLFAFYGRRLRPLYPPLLLVCVAYALFVLLSGREAPHLPAWGAIARALTYSTNVPLLWHGVPDSKWLHHSWSLAVEEQFYLLWPVALIVLLRFGRGTAAGLALAGAAAAVALRAVPLLRPFSYEVLRWDALLLGCAAALIPLRASRPVTSFGVVIVLYYLLVPRAQELSNFDFLVGALGSVLFLLHARSAAWVAHPLLRYFGRISYSLYLWHVLLMRLGWPGWCNLLVSLAAAELAYRLVERPFLSRPQAAPELASVAPPASAIAEPVEPSTRSASQAESLAVRAR
ncbi:MAG: acyltransferase [Proteobacteria bacterium]|nr:acyltransferase [Pseudomonadota bacterium]